MKASSTSLAFEPETDAEEFHAFHKGQEARGAFLQSEILRSRDTEPDWDAGDIGNELESHAVAALRNLPSTKKKASGSRQRVRKTSSASNLPASIKRIGTVAVGMGWISPKSHSAIDALKDGGRKLSRSEENALRYLLERCEKLSQFRPDVKVIRRKLDADSE